MHPGSVIVPVALAVGEARKATGTELSAAVAVGYEVAARIGAPAKRGLHARGFHASGIIGPLAGAVVAGRLYGLTGAQIAQAMGLAGSMSGGLMEYMSDGSWSKWLHLGWSAHGAIVAAELAARGFGGPASVLDGPHGLYAAFLGPEAVDLTNMSEALGDEWRGAAAMIKYYPCAHVIQPYIDGALSLRAAHDLAPDDIAEVTCHVPPWSVPIVCEPRAPRIRPTTEIQAIASLPFQIAATLIDGRVDLDTITPESRARADVLELAARVMHIADPTLDHAFDGRLEIVMRDGKSLSTSVTSSGIDPEKVRTKFRLTAGRALPPDQLTRLESAIDGIGRSDVISLAELLR